MSDSERGQVTKSAAEIYDEFFVPAIFQEWVPHVLDAANVSVGQTVLDVACGTGIVARGGVSLVGDSGKVIGIDINDGMLDVARKKSSDVEWWQGQAENLPFEDNFFDAVVCQFALMFFEDRSKAIQEMLRVVKPDHKVVIAVWGALADTPGYLAMEQLLLDLFGEDAANGIRAPYNLGDKNVLTKVLDNADVSNYDIKTIKGTARFPSISDWMFTEIKGWVLADAIDDEQYDHLLEVAGEKMQSFVQEDASVAFELPTHIITLIK